MMAVKTFILISGAALALASLGARAQGDDVTIRAIPDPSADLPDAVTKEIPLPDPAAQEGVTHSEAGRSGARRDDGLAKARDAAADGLDRAGGAGDDESGDDQEHDGLATAGDHAADDSADGLATAADAAARGDEFGRDVVAAAEASREEFGRSHEPSELPDEASDLPSEVPTDVPPAPGDTPPDPVGVTN